MALNPIRKGKAGEVEFCKWLHRHLDIKTERNYNQSQGGADIIIDDFIIEVKRREALDLASWWYQVIIASKKYPETGLIPVVAFRQNRKPWEFLLPARLITGLDRGYVRCSESIFLQFSKYVVDGKDDCGQNLYGDLHMK